MAERKAVEVQAPAGAVMPVGLRVFRWEGVLQNDTCAPLNVAGYERLVIQPVGTWNGGTITVEGALDPASTAAFDALRDNTGTAISLTADGMRRVGEEVVQIKPVLTGGGASTDLDVFLLVATTARR